MGHPEGMDQSWLHLQEATKGKDSPLRTWCWHGNISLFFVTLKQGLELSVRKWEVFV